MNYWCIVKFVRCFTTICAVIFGVKISTPQKKYVTDVPKITTMDDKLNHTCDTRANFTHDDNNVGIES